MIVSLLLGVAIGALMGLTGAGGGILAVPALVAGMGWSMQQAAPVALIAVAGGAALGAFDAWRKHLVRYRAAMLIALIALPFTSLGIRAAHVLPQRWLLLLFACVMLAVAIRAWLRTRPDAPAADRTEGTHGAVGRINPDTGRFYWNGRTAWLFAAIGAITGLMTGLLGVGGGFIIVPMLQRFTNVSMHGVVATALLVIALVGSSGIVMALAHGTVIVWPVALLFAGATAVGMMLARKHAHRLSERQVGRVFAVVVFGVACWLFVKAATAF